jgi:hypothetical protein
MAIVIGDTSSAQSGDVAVSSISVSHVVAGDDNALYVVVNNNSAISGQTISSCKFNGITMTQLGTANQSARCTTFFLANPPVGTYSVVATLSGSAARMIIGAMSLKGVDVDGTPYGTTVVNVGEVATISVVVSSAVGELVLAGFGAHYARGNQTPGAPAVEWFDRSQTDTTPGYGGALGVTGNGSYDNGAASVTMSSSGGGTARRQAVATPFKPAPDNAGNPVFIE